MNNRFDNISNNISIIENFSYILLILTRSSYLIKYNIQKKIKSAMSTVHVCL